MNSNGKILPAACAAVLVVLGLALLYSRQEAMAAGAAVASPSGDQSKGGSVWGASYFPNIALTTHDGRSVRFFDDLIKDKVVAINFIYTTCPDACPMETARLLEVQEILGERMGQDVFFYSITIDPEHDTQPVLANFVQEWGLGPGWTFLTGKEEDITLLRRKLGLYIEDIQGPDSRDHNLSLIIGNQATGRWMKRSPFENPYVLAKQIGGELHNWKVPSTTKRAYAEAPKLREISQGESLFRTRCAACHTIGNGEVHELAARRIGPDLYRITEQRERSWLRRWLAEPDKMLAEEDPLAISLLAAYDGVAMPNLRLNEVEVEALLEHIEETSREVQKHVEMGHHPDPWAAKGGGHPAEHSATHAGAEPKMAANGEAGH